MLIALNLAVVGKLCLSQVSVIMSSKSTRLRLAGGFKSMAGCEDATKPNISSFRSVYLILPSNSPFVKSSFFLSQHAGRGNWLKVGIVSSPNLRILFRNSWKDSDLNF